ncbi:hypothetical protein PLEOSDRAFT_1104401 [Pleurotus ostreatus PC15]|uniref:Uncharacterized protein n=1 Tax=Pleurotus ostreatus (strain PC15) TaxID=1137138 RepID=A0A067NL15_PLEO1|nr:hypothetical protein PLEOSDRAFT_1104401 [Pleurotus ostreatus PC15]
MKSYSSQGVQTDDVPILLERISKQAGEDPTCDTERPSAGLIKANSSAYSYSDVPVHDFLADTGHETREIRRQKYTQLPCNRPSQISNPNERRIVSLPETAPPVSVKASVEATRRVVSASSARQSSRSHRLNHEREYSQMSTSTFEEVEDDALGSGGFPCGNLDLPRTPSPPSSPESVTIISNPNFQVPATFLRARQGQEPYAFRPTQDEDGWVTWANSPPRPIPALHGPLSLPYARCPSGAEGTVIEKGTEIPRMIWGLDTENTHSKDRGAEHIPERNPPTVQHRDHPREQAAGANLRSVHSVTRAQEVKPSFEHECANSLRGLGLSMPGSQSRPFQPTISKDGPGRFQSFNTPEANTSRRPPTMHLVPEGLPLLVASGIQRDRSDHPAAAYLQHVRNNSGARESEKAWDHQVTSRTPVTTSPNWTPLFSSYLEMFGSPDVSVFDPTYGTPRLGFEPLRQPPASQPLPSVVDELSEELRRFVLQSITSPRASDNQMDTPHSIALSDYYKQAFEHKHNLRLQKPTGTTDALSYHPGMNHSGMSPIQPRPPPNSPMPPLRSLHSNNGPRSQLSSPNQVYQSPGSMEVKSASNVRHLRSVPFARLMQRRLSVVQEEEPSPPALGKVHLHPAFSTPDDFFDIPESPRPSQTTWRSQPPNHNLRPKAQSMQPLGPWTRANSDASNPLVQEKDDIARITPSNEKANLPNKKRRRPKVQRG